MAWRQVMWRLAEVSPETFRRQRAAAPELRADDQAISEFWERQPAIATKLLTPLATKTKTPA